MFKKGKDSLKKGLTILCCAAFISMSFPGVTHAATEPSSKEFLFPEKLFSLISPILPFGSSNFSVGIYDLAASYFLSAKDKKPPKDKEKEKENQDSEDSYKDHGNSTSKKKANGRD